MQTKFEYILEQRKLFSTFLSHFGCLIALLINSIQFERFQVYALIKDPLRFEAAWISILLSFLLCIWIYFSGIQKNLHSSMIE